MTLEEAIEEVKRPFQDPTVWGLVMVDDEATNTILNAVASGQFVTKADADLAVAEARAEAAEAEVARLTEALTEWKDARRDVHTMDQWNRLAEAESRLAALPPKGDTP